MKKIGEDHQEGEEIYTKKTDMIDREEGEPNMEKNASTDPLAEAKGMKKIGMIDNLEDLRGMKTIVMTDHDVEVRHTKMITIEHLEEDQDTKMMLMTYLPGEVHP
jgi:DNA gyrase/topoisomerase IV subunit B